MLTSPPVTSNPAQPVEVRELRKSLGGRLVLDRVNLSVIPGETLGLLGPNGAGKSTLIRMMAGLRLPDSGTVEIFGQRPGSPRAKELTGYVPQEIALYPILTARQNLTTFARYQGLRGDRVKEAVQKALEWSGLSERGSDRTGDLSGGMRRRLNIAAGILHDPKILFLDEPTVGVDPQSRERIFAMIGELRCRGISIVYTTHYMEEAERLCDRIAIIDRGCIIAEGTRQELVRQTVGERQLFRLKCEIPMPERLRQTLLSRNVSVEGQDVHVSLLQPAEEIRGLLELFDAEKVPVQSLSLESHTLESVFLHLTGKELRE